MPTQSFASRILSFQINTTRRIDALDWLMLLFALLSIAQLAWLTWWSLPSQTIHLIAISDYVICGVFLAEFLWRWNRAGWRWRFPLRNWYDVLGMVPAFTPWLRALRTLRLLRIIILLSQAGIRASIAPAEALILKLLNGVVDAISGTITVAVLNEVAEVLTRGTYTRNVAAALEENNMELRAMIREKLRDDPRAGKLARLPFYNDIVEAVIDSGLHVVRDVLHDPRTDELVADILRDNITQLREAVREKDA